MMRSIAIGTLMLLAWPAAAAPVKWKTTMVLPACVDAQDSQKAYRLLAQGDTEAAAKFLATRNVVDASCTLFKQGETVVGDTDGALTGIVRVRRKGDPTEFSVPVDALELDVE